MGHTLYHYLRRDEDRESVDRIVLRMRSQGPAPAEGGPRERVAQSESPPKSECSL
jgi:hypothetical protein